MCSPSTSFISYRENVLTSREELESRSTANSSYQASLADEETFLFQQKKFSSYRVLKLSGRKKRLEKRKTRQLARRRLRRLKRQKVEAEQYAMTLASFSVLIYGREDKANPQAESTNS